MMTVTVDKLYSLIDTPDLAKNAMIYGKNVTPE
jgi:hypothetical protein